mmetsp:Transcript_123984/g.239084  ORF Transcript_123984/g.239084 Transcript_123984/m.239084 type:complete len:91 (-) Transcript_123984:619-891(-)
MCATAQAMFPNCSALIPVLFAIAAEEIDSSSGGLSTSRSATDQSKFAIFCVQKSGQVVIEAEEIAVRSGACSQRSGEQDQAVFAMSCALN